MPSWTQVILNNAVPQCTCLPVPLPTCSCRAASAFHKQAKDVDVTEI